MSSSASDTAASKPLAGRVALITGATRGIGRAVAIAYAKAGAHLVLTGRTSGALEEVDDEVRKAQGKDAAGATLVTLNLKHGEKIDSLGPTLFQRFGKLDVLVGCAGILGPLSPLGHVTTDAWNEIVEINLTANWRLLRTLDPLLQRSDAGRAILVSSGAASGAMAYWGPYAVTKAGLETLAKTYAAENANTNVRVNIINPGPIRTRMRAKAFPGEDAMTLKTPEDIAPLFVALALPSHTSTAQIHDFKTGTVR
ncbi:MAG: SDR family NAD(P)-dependent oxidoreductase [Hyphomicrobiaceae bacterium]|nr:SDR family NAD(P)-dependent oxidoreductase [Hyphomicrobiaceae bacterium]